MSICKSSLFNTNSNYIKIGNGQIVAIEGSNNAETLLLSDLRMPYKQLVKGRIILKEGQTNYLLNHLGLGDNATFLAIKATYNPKSVIESDNYINWSFYDDLTRTNAFAQMMILTGNSTNRIKQLFLSNPNTKYPVIIDVIVAVIDDQYTFFNDTNNQIGTSFTNLEYTHIKSHIVGSSLVITDVNSLPLIYINLSSIISVEKSGNIIVIDDGSIGRIFLQFKTEYDAYQAISIFNYVLENPYVNVTNIAPDDTPPVIYFLNRVDGTGDWISLNGATGSSYSTNDGLTFSTTIDLVNYNNIDSSTMINILVDNINDNRDGEIQPSENNILMKSIYGITISNITATGSYTIDLSVNDLANNNVTAKVNIDIK